MAINGGAIVAQATKTISVGHHDLSMYQGPYGIEVDGVFTQCATEDEAKAAFTEAKIRLQNEKDVEIIVTADPGPPPVAAKSRRGKK